MYRDQKQLVEGRVDFEFMDKGESTMELWGMASGGRSSKLRDYNVNHKNKQRG